MYLMITVKDNGKSKRLRVRVISETSSLMYAEEMAADWSPKAHQDKDGNWVHTEHLISTDLITRRVEYVQDLHYGEFVPKNN